MLTGNSRLDFDDSNYDADTGILNGICANAG